MRDASKRSSTQEYLHLIGVPDLPPLTSPFDPGYDPVTLASHLDQSWHLMDSLKMLWPRDSSGRISTCAQILESYGSNVEKASLLCQSRHKRS